MGGFRVVVTQRWRMQLHVCREREERIFIVPDLLVDEPVPWDHIPWVIAQAQNYTNKCLNPVNHCGECKACCKTLYFKTDKFTKHSHTMCQHACASGCKIYFARPRECQVFECRWLKSQRLNDRMAPELRPDRCGVIFTDDTQDHDPLVFEMHVDAHRPDCLDAKEVRAFVGDMRKAGYKDKLITYYVGETR